MNKKLIILGVAIGILIVVCLAVFMIDKHKADNLKEPSNIIEFEYGYGSYNGGFYNYKITRNADSTVSFIVESANGADLNADNLIDNKQLEELESIIKTQNISSWNGFDKSNKNALDGYSFSLFVEYSDGTKIIANGYMKYPKHYDKIHKILIDYLNTLIL